MKKAGVIFGPGMQKNRLWNSLGRAIALAALVALCCPQWTSAKKKPPTTKTVTGRVFDAHGHGIANAVVTLTNLTTKKKLAIYSTQDGSYQFSGLSLFDDYEIQASYDGKPSEKRKVGSWDSRDRLTLYLHIPPPKDQ